MLAAKKCENSGTDAASSVEQNSGGKEVTRSRNTSKEEAEIDRTSTRTCYACMYALYGLSEDEIKIVEEKNFLVCWDFLHEIYKEHADFL